MRIPESGEKPPAIRTHSCFSRGMGVSLFFIGVNNLFGLILSQTNDPVNGPFHTTPAITDGKPQIICKTTACNISAFFVRKSD